MRPLSSSLILGLLFVAGLAFAAGRDAKLVGEWTYLQGLSDGHVANVGGSFTARADGAFSDTRRIRGPRADFGADTSGTWSTQGDRLTLHDTAGQPVQSYTYLVGHEVRDGRPLVMLTLKGEGLVYLLGRPDV